MKIKCIVFMVTIVIASAKETSNQKSHHVAEPLLKEARGLVTEAARLLRPMSAELTNYAVKAISQTIGLFLNDGKTHSSALRGFRSLENEGSQLREKAIVALEPLRNRVRGFVTRALGMGTRALGLPDHHLRDMPSTVTTPLRYISEILLYFAFEIYSKTQFSDDYEEREFGSKTRGFPIVPPEERKSEDEH